MKVPRALTLEYLAWLRIPLSQVFPNHLLREGPLARRSRRATGQLGRGCWVR